MHKPAILVGSLFGEVEMKTDNILDRFPIMWTGSRGDISQEQITNFEKLNNVKFPSDYIDIVLEFNGGFANPNLIEIENKREVVFESLINWDPNKKANIYFWHEILGNGKVVPFGKDPFGNVICFDFSQSNEPSIMFWDHESDSLIFVANSLNSFLGKLRASPT